MRPLKTSSLRGILALGIVALASCAVNKQEAAPSNDKSREHEPAASAALPMEQSEAPSQAKGHKPTIGRGAGGGAPPSPTFAPHNIAPGTKAYGVAPPPAQEPDLGPIDPNGRFATTYRPGGGHLAAFESAVARGIVPEAERELVSDIGARYWPNLAEPTTKALLLQSDLERAKLPPSGGPFHVRLALRSSSKNPSARPRLSVHLVLDVSGSMAGEPIQQARAAARNLVERLAPTDDFSLVTFSTDAQVLVNDAAVGPRRQGILKTIATIQETGGTNIGEGLRLGYAQAATRTIPQDAVRVVLLLSDGRANSGITDRGRLSKLALDAFQDGIQTSTFGLGSDYDGALMSAIAQDGAGGYYYLPNADQIAPALNTELEKRLDPVATAVEVRVRLKDGVDLLNVYGSRRLNQEEAARVRAIEEAADTHAAKKDNIKRDRQDDTQGGMRFFMPAFARADSHAMLLKLRAPKGTGSKQVAIIELKYKDRLSKTNVTEEFRVTLDYANSDAESARTSNASVARTVQGFAAGESLMNAASAVMRGDRGSALALLTEREQILRQAAITLEEPGFVRDADRLARMRSHMGAVNGLGEPMVLAMLLESAARTHLR